MPPKKKPLELDGRTGEGGGQLVRIACALAAVTSQPIRIHHVRGNRPGGGLKSQHVTSIQWLADASGAQVEGLEVGSPTLEFRPSRPPTALWKQPPGQGEELQQHRGQQQQRRIRIAAASGAASALLVFQAVFPFLLFAAGSGSINDDNNNKDADAEEEPIELEIHGGTNVSFSPSYEYLDQVLLPALQAHFGIRVERRLERRRWSQGSSSSSSSSQPKGVVWFRFRPLRLGQALKLQQQRQQQQRPASTSSSRGGGGEEGRLPWIKRIDVSVLAPAAVRAPLETAIAAELEARFPSSEKTEVRFVVGEDSGHPSRLYALLVAHSETETERGLRWGCDWLYDRSTKRKTPSQLGAEVARRVCADLAAEVARHSHSHSGSGSVVDEHLQDQLVVFQALAAGRTSFPRPEVVEEEEEDDLEQPAMERLGIVGGEGEVRMRMRRDKKTYEPFGEGSMHTRTARWVASELLPGVRWFDGGRVCEGVGLSFDG